MPNSQAGQLHASIFSVETSSLIQDPFSEAAWFIVEQAMASAENLGHAQIGLAALLLAMTQNRNEEIDINSTQTLSENLRELLRSGEPAAHPLELTQEFFTEDVQRVLQTASQVAENDQTQIEPQHLWAAVLAEAPQFIKQVAAKLSFPAEHSGDSSISARTGPAITSACAQRCWRWPGRWNWAGTTPHGPSTLSEWLDQTLY
jgi:ATP-dependent Clp protease ATP-binding subunit ClpA